MYSINPNYYQCNYSTINKIGNNCVGKKSQNFEHAPLYSNDASQNLSNPAFMASGIKTRLTTKDEKNKYSDLQNILDKQSRKELNQLLKKGVLLNSDSNDKSTVLDNLHKISTNERAKGLDKIITLKETIHTLNNPFVITQEFGDIPNEYREYATEANQLLLEDGEQNNIDVDHSGTCVAASVEFNMAQKHPAEFARFVEGLSSPDIAVKKTIHLNNLADNTLDAIWLLNAFEIPYEAKDFNKADLTFAPDKNAIVRAQIQTTNKDKTERSVVDVLMQSTFMQIGSQQTYNSICDTRHGKFNQNDKGLIEFEKTFTESVAEDKNKISVTYQTVDENAKLIGYETDKETLKRHLISALDRNENVIIGYTQVDSTNTIINGHEITIIGYKKDSNNKIKFICNDTDDDITKQIEYNEDYLLPKIHHAALPHDIVKNDVELVENWVEGLNLYHDLKRQQAA